MSVLPPVGPLQPNDPNTDDFNWIDEMRQCAPKNAFADISADLK